MYNQSSLLIYLEGKATGANGIPISLGMFSPLYTIELEEIN